MIRSLLFFVTTFVAGAALALLVRAAVFDPHAGHDLPVGPREYAPMVTNALAPAPLPASAATPATHDHPSAHHATSAAKTSASTPTSAGSPSDQPVNTVCAICGMDVDPSLPTAMYQGKTIGFGCRACPPKFKRDPDRYGPAYLRNEVIER